MKFKTTCQNCRHSYDIFEEKCPNCNYENVEKPKGRSYEMMTFLPFGKQISLFLVGWVGLQLIALIVQIFILLIPGFMVINPDGTAEISDKAALLTNILCYAFLFGALIAIINKDGPKVAMSFRKPAALIGILCGFAIIGISSCYELIPYALHINQSNNNQQAVESLITSNPFVSFVMVVALGPICEEMTYRLGLYSFLRRKSKLLAILLSAVIFGLIHFNFEVFLYPILAQTPEAYQSAMNSIIVELINIPEYIIAGVGLSLTYEYLGFAGSTYAHLTNNLISWIASLIPPAVCVSKIFLK